MENCLYRVIELLSKEVQELMREDLSKQDFDDVVFLKRMINLCEHHMNMRTGDGTTSGGEKKTPHEAEYNAGGIIMRKETNFSESKLSKEDFSRKYWKNGKFPYQYHTGSVMDGRDEREQFLFNNCRALKELMDKRQKKNRKLQGLMQEDIKALQVEQKKMKILHLITIAMTAAALLLQKVCKEGNDIR